MAATTRLLTIDDFEKLPLEQVKNHELVDGKLVPEPGNTFVQNELRDLLIELLRPIVRRGKLGTVIAEQDYEFSGNAHSPDVTFFSTAKEPLVNRKVRVQRFVPDLAIEVVSEHDTAIPMLRKKDRYRKCGVREVWIVLHETKEVLAYSEQGNRILTGNLELSTGLIPNFSITISDLFNALS